jgi:hypothetical protein
VRGKEEVDARFTSLGEGVYESLEEGGFFVVGDVPFG